MCCIGLVDGCDASVALGVTSSLLVVIGSSEGQELSDEGAIAGSPDVGVSLADSDSALSLLRWYFRRSS